LSVISSFSSIGKLTLPNFGRFKVTDYSFPSSNPRIFAISHNWVVNKF
jgi:hypothetical protein